MQTEENFEASGDPGVRGFLLRPSEIRFLAVLAHGAGSNAKAPVLTAIAKALCDRGGLVLRCDLPYRQARASGPPRPAEAARDREGLRRAVEALRTIASGPVLLGGHSYGGRQASMLAAEDGSVAQALLLMSYPLHPPGKPLQLRTAHLGSLTMPCLFVHGTRDPFGTVEEMQEALRAVITAELMVVHGAGHDLRKVEPASVADWAAGLVQPVPPGAHLA